MKNNVTEFRFPASAQEAAGLMNRLKAKAVLVAGGTRRTRSLSPAVETLVDISDLPLRHVKADKAWLRIGALCTIDALEKSPLLAGWAGGVIAKTAGLGSNALARSMGTVGGNVVHAHPYNNLPAVFLALDAVAAFTDGKGGKSMPFAETLSGDAAKLFGRKHLLTEIRVPARTRAWAAAAQRIALTKSSWESYAQCVVAVDLKGGLIRGASIAVSSLLPRAARLFKAESLLAGQAPGEEAARAAAAAAADELNALTAGSAAKAYAREVAAVLVRRTLMEAFSAEIPH